MLVTFSCKAGADITMFGDVAVRLIELMGHSGSVPGAILSEDVPEALAKLRSGVSAAESPPPELAADEEQEDKPVSLALRAYPLIELLEAAARDNCDVMWEQQISKYIQTD